MSTILGRFTKQPSEVLDYIVDYSEWFEGREDAPATQTTFAEAGIAVTASTISGQRVIVVLSGGTSGQTYKITTRLTTNASPAIVREADFEVRVKEV
jgi:hypothetical protein